MLENRANSKYLMWLSRLLAVIVLISTISVKPVFAADELDAYVTINSQRIPIPETYQIDKAITNIGSIDGSSPYFNAPSDIFITDTDEIYVVDTSNNRVLKLSEDGEVLKIYTNSAEKAFRQPEGVFVDASGDLYVADTGNSRVVHIDNDDKFIEQFVAPVSELIPEGTPFKPSKLLVSDTGLLYLVQGEKVLVLDADNEFKQYFGQTKIGYNLVENLVRMFGSETQQKFMTKRTASSYVNITLANNYIYAATKETIEGEIKKLNSIGTNVYRKYRNASTGVDIFADLKKKFRADLMKKEFKFGEVFDDDGNYVDPSFADVAVDDNGIVYALEDLKGKVYQYDMDGNLLTVFGGLGEKKGTFSRPSSIDVDSKGNVYILDKLNNSLQVFKPTAFIEKVHEAVVAYDDGLYDEAYALWQEVLEIDENYELAHIGIGNALFKQERFEEAMASYKIADDQANYSKAFDEYRYTVLRAHFFLIVLITVLLVVGVYFGLIKLIKTSDKATNDFIFSRGTPMGIWQGVKIGFNVIVHPFETFEAVKVNRDRITLWPAVIIFAMAFVVKVAYVFVVHYPLASMKVEDANILFEAVKILLAPLTWVIASFAISSIIDGESKPKEIFLTASYCMVPYILLIAPLMFLTNVMSQSEQFWFMLITNAATIWTFVLFFISLMQLNDYSFGKTILTYILSGFAIVLIWFIAILIYVLSFRLLQFVTGIITEIQIAWF